MTASGPTLAEPGRECRRTTQLCQARGGRVRAAAPRSARDQANGLRCDYCEAGTRAEIKQPGEKQRIGDTEEQLCNRGARTKQECRAQGQHRSVIIVLRSRHSMQTMVPAYQS